jgi:hypothetical protein
MVWAGVNPAPTRNHSDFDGLYVGFVGADFMSARKTGKTENRTGGDKPYGRG